MPDIGFQEGYEGQSRGDFLPLRRGYAKWRAHVSEYRASALIGPGGTGESLEAWAGGKRRFTARGRNGAISLSANWKGNLIGFVGASASTSVEIVALIRAVDERTVVWRQTLYSEEMSAVVEGGDFRDINGGVSQAFVLPALQLGKQYQFEIEVRCSSAVIFSVGATGCDFGREVDSDRRLKLLDLYIDWA